MDKSGHLNAKSSSPKTAGWLEFSPDSSLWHAPVARKTPLRVHARCCAPGPILVSFSFDFPRKIANPRLRAARAGLVQRATPCIGRETGFSRASGRLPWTARRCSLTIHRSVRRPTLPDTRRPHKELSPDPVGTSFFRPPLFAQPKRPKQLTPVSPANPPAQLFFRGSDLLARFPARAIAHARDTHELCYTDIFGLSRPSGFPSWSAAVRRISTNRSVTPANSATATS